jgi:hypothetical protein
MINVLRFASLRLPILLIPIAILAPLAYAQPGIRWTVTGFTDALGGGPATGPALEARGSAGSICGDASQNVFLADNQFVDIVTPDGQRHHLAGTGHPGLRDGPAYRAMFRMGINSYYAMYNIACNKLGVFIGDTGNRRIRRLFRTPHGWMVETWAGGGAKRLHLGENAPAKTVSLPRTFALAALPNGEILVGSYGGYYRVSPDGTRVRFEHAWPPDVARRKGRKAQLNVVAADADRDGNAYFLSRTPNVVVRVGADGTVSHWAGLVLFKPPKPYAIGDGPRKFVFLDATDSLVASPAGNAVFVCGGDEYDIRRLPTNDDSTMTLMQNGQWYHASVHPNRSRGGATFRPSATGRLRPDGRLTLLMVTSLPGRNGQGMLYGLLNTWTGMTQYVEGTGLLPTRIFRLSPVQSE